MRVLHLTLLTFCQLLLASFVLYSALTSALPVVAPKSDQPTAAIAPSAASEPIKGAPETKIEPKSAAVEQKQAPKVAPAKPSAAQVEPKSAPVESGVPKLAPNVEVKPKSVEQPKVEVAAAEQKVAEAKPASYSAESSVVVPEPIKPILAPLKVEVPQAESVLTPRKDQATEEKPIVAARVLPVAVVEVQKVAQVAPVASAPAAVHTDLVVPIAPVAAASEPLVQLPKAEALISAKSDTIEPAEQVKYVASLQQVIEFAVHKDSPPSAVQEPAKQVEDIKPVEVKLVVPVPPISVPVVVPAVMPVVPALAGGQVKQVVVNGGLGPLHLLASTLCSFQPDRPVADETLNQLYSQRAAVRKSLFEFMSLKFTNLEKLSSRLNPGLEVMPAKAGDANRPGETPSHGWPVVGQCTAHDLRLMAEAAWCECAEGASCGPATKSATSPVSAVAPAASVSSPSSLPIAVSSSSSSSASADGNSQVEPSNRISGNRHMRAGSETGEQVPAKADQSSVISKLLHVADVRDAPVVESSIAGLNLTQQQLDKIQAQVTSTRECRRNALKLARSLFNHLAEDQRSASDSWPALYAQMSSDDCARKRMIDVVNALSTFRSESSSIRRDNLEFAFAMDDLRAKVLENEVNVPLTFDKQFIEVEQFLQQSVKLMLANIDPEKAKLTSMRYRSLIPTPFSADDQCVDLPQRLLAKNQPTGCNPNQFGQLPDVLRMTAKSMELWSIESELSRRLAKGQEYSDAAQRSDVRECVANLVAS